MTDTTTTTTVLGDESSSATTVVDTYLDTWNEANPAKRRQLIQAYLAADLWYRDPMLEADGLDAYDAMIGTVQAQFPGLVMRRTSPIDGHRDLVRFNWAFGKPGEAPALAGLDVAKYDGSGKLHRIIGFAPEAIPEA